MNKIKSMYCIPLFLAMFIVSLTVSPLIAADIETITGRKFVQLARGGILYDNWPAELNIKIDKTHPSYPAAGKQTGSNTWRCKECHGWDYKGKNGSYATGSHYTGIKGIRAYANGDPIEIVKVLKDSTHGLGDMLSENDYDALAIFVSYGQIDTDLYINRTSKKGIGDLSNGGRIFLSTCIKCHGADGKEINLSTEPGQKMYIGTASNGNPWESLHKIRWGHPATPMIPLIFLGLKEQLDVLAFCQALPEK